MAELRWSRWPLDVVEVTWPFAAADPAWGPEYRHRGIDMSCVVGTPVYAPADGLVVAHVGDGTFGGTVSLDHEGTPYWSIYAHLTRALVAPGVRVKAGDRIGLSGDTGLSTAPHLHWQVSTVAWYPRDIAYARDPMAFFAPAETEDEMNAEDVRAVAREVVAELVFGEARFEELQRLGRGPLEPRVEAIESVWLNNLSGVTLARFEHVAQIGAVLVEAAVRIQVILEEAADALVVPSSEERVEALGLAGWEAGYAEASDE